NFYVSDSLSIILHTGQVDNPAILTNMLILTAISTAIVYIGIQLFKRTAFKASEENLELNDLDEKSTRLFFLDYLRVGLAILVVLHHIAGVYGASVPWYYYIDPPINNLGAFTTLLTFMLFNQSWFMGAFFLLSGYFIPGSYDRKGFSGFIKNKLLRFGLPLLVFYFVIQPISMIGLYLPPAPRITEPLTLENFTQIAPELFGFGPLWFVAMLLIFSTGYALIRILWKKDSNIRKNPSSIQYLGLGIFTVCLAAGSYFFRMLIPIGKTVWGFPSLAYLPQYLSFFILGIIAYRKDWLRKIPTAMGNAGFVSALVSGVFLFTLAFSGNIFSFALTPALENAMGNGHWQSAVYAAWDSIFAVGLSLGLITLFRRLFNRPSGFGNFLAQHSYTVFIIHIPIIVFIAYLMRGFNLESLLKFGLTSIVAVPVCFAIAAIIRKIPFVTKVL
ncbi:MAG: acyltransferase family protein, partial [Anaerolineaceae bacterium]|nr:acyltransferase family protein [Anaerolineaceae bacterium]